ncbi:hypothetical protein PVAND_016630 [Polypedilum vanderplanki]|uniref:C2H2-type domain-containing protein n=1 Tax=Polypedilum vanderplanki TaxID=319348 RepID=A0A9J6BFZ4_POLVA|nr:hypothetical protein PVAND_016630 [Polypedilum vanderplanki]
MEISIKQEPFFDEELMNLDSNQCCFLCYDGQQIFREILKHFRVSHTEDYNQLPDDSIVQLCSCPDAIQLQFQLLNHMLSRSLPPKLEEIKDEFPEIKTELNDENSEISNESSSESDRKIKSKRKRRRRAELSETEAVKCNLCPRIFTKSQSLQHHYDLMHDPSNQFKCTRCQHGHCRTLRNLNAHLKSHDEEEVKNLIEKDSKVCPKCSKAWQTDLQLYHHMLTHREKLLECDHCGMKFNMKNTLWRHILTHYKHKRKEKEPSRYKKELCQYCSVLVSSFNLKRHIRTNHSDDKFIYKCDFEGCNKSFTEAQNLKDHKNYHLGIKPYICEFCSKGFERIKSLRRHKVRHTDPQRYKCEICHECFVTRTSLNNHVQRQHHDIGNDTKPFACDFEGCNSTFKYKNYLQHHIRDVHIKKRIRVRNKESQRINFFEHHRNKGNNSGGEAGTSQNETIVNRDFWK